MLKYPILLVHGLGFRDSKRFNYWGRIPSLLEKKGIQVFYGNQDGNGTTGQNGRMLKHRIEEILKETGMEKINVIAHSKGGLDMRYVISTLHMGQYIASLTTICTPHNGSKAMDRTLKRSKVIIRVVAKIWDFILLLLGDKDPNAYLVFHTFSTNYARQFNKNNRDDPRVYYQSYAFIMKQCSSDLILCLPNWRIKRLYGDNDGLLTPKAVKWGNFHEGIKSNSNRGISHCDAVDLRRHRFTKKQGNGVSDILEVYNEIVRTLEKKGF